MNDLFLEELFIVSSTAMHGDDLTGYQISDVPSVEIDENLQQMLMDNSADSEQ